VNDLLNALGESVKTDMPTSDMAVFLKLTKTLDTENVTSLVVDAWKKDSLLSVSHIQVGPVTAFILVPRVGNWSEIRDLAENIFRLDALAAHRQRRYEAVDAQAGEESEGLQVRPVLEFDQHGAPGVLDRARGAHQGGGQVGGFGGRFIGGIRAVGTQPEQRLIETPRAQDDAVFTGGEVGVRK